MYCEVIYSSGREQENRHAAVGGICCGETENVDVGSLSNSAPKFIPFGSITHPSSA